MARSIRIEYAEAFYHVMARGNHREAIFHDEQDRLHFLKTLGEACAMTGWGVHARVLMSNHYHLMVETPEPNLVEGMKWLQNTVTRRYNVRHRAWGRPRPDVDVNCTLTRKPPSGAVKEYDSAGRARDIPVPSDLIRKW